MSRVIQNLFLAFLDTISLQASVGGTTWMLSKNPGITQRVA